MRGSGEARLLASGAVLQQVAQGSGLLALLVIVTLLARRLDSVAELGAYGLVASLSGYLLVLRNSVASAAVRAMAGAAEGEERASVFVVARRLYALVGFATGLLIAARGAWCSRARCSTASWRATRALGGLGLGALTAVGHRGEHRPRPPARRAAVRDGGSGRDRGGGDQPRADGHADPRPARTWRCSSPLSGALPLLSGLICAVLVRRLRLPGAGGPSARARRHRAAIVPTAGWLLVIELSNLAMYASGRIVLGAYRTPTAVGPLRGPRARAQPALRARRRARGADRAHRVAVRGRGRRAPAARARGARQPLHARAVRAAGA